jgi:hypothetical protein
MAARVAENAYQLRKSGQDVADLENGPRVAELGSESGRQRAVTRASTASRCSGLICTHECDMGIPARYEMRSSSTGCIFVDGVRPTASQWAQGEAVPRL